MPGPAADDEGDVVLVDLLLHHRLALRRLTLLELGFERRQLAVADLGHALEVAFALGAIGFLAQLVDGAGDILHPLERLLLLRPASGQLVPGRLRVGELALEWLSHVVRLLRHRGQLDLQLAHAPLRLVELQRRRVDLHAHARCSLVHEVDRLVGEEAAGDVAVGKDCRGHEGGVADADAVVRLVALLETTEDGDRVDGGRLADEDRLETALQCRVLLDVLSVLVERRRADGAQLAAREHRLQHVRGVDRTLGSSRADDRVQLVDEDDQLALGGRDLGEDGLQPLLELAAVLRAGEQRADVERPHALAFETLGHVASDDPLREPLDDRGLAHSRVADQHGVVLGAPRQHLDHTADLLVAADDRVELARLGEGRQVAPELLEGLVRAFGILRGDALCAAHFLDPHQQLIARDGLEREEQVLDRHVVVVELLGFGACLVQRARQRGRDARLLRRAFDGRLLGEPRFRLRPQRLSRRDERARQLLVEQRQQQMLGVDLGVAASPRILHGRCDGFLRPDRQPVEVHVSPVSWAAAARAVPPSRARRRAGTAGARTGRHRPSRAAGG